MSDRPCHTCRFRRPRMPVPSIVERLDVPLVDRLSSIIEQLETWLDEQRGQELGLLQQLIHDRAEPVWPRPVYAHDHCGLIGDRPRVLEILNPGDDCEQHEPGPGPNRPCQTCRWLRRPRQTTTEIVAAAGSPALWQFAQQVTKVAETRIQSQVIEAVKSGGYLREQSELLPTCARLSTAGRVVVGPVLNWTNACAHWEAG